MFAPSRAIDSTRPTRTAASAIESFPCELVSIAIRGNGGSRHVRAFGWIMRPSEVCSPSMMPTGIVKAAPIACPPGSIGAV